MPGPKALPGINVRAACNRHGCREDGVCYLAEALFIFAKFNWVLVISSSILRFSFFILPSFRRDSVEGAGGG